MNISENVKLTSGEFIILLISALGGVGFTYLPNEIIKDTGQDAWMCCIIGAIYPIYVFFIASFLCKNCPNDNIFTLSEKFFGKYIGRFLNAVFAGFFIFVATSELSGLSFILRTYATFFLKNFQVFIAFLIPVAYICYNGIKPMGKICEMIFYTNILLIFIPMFSLKYGSILNVMPVFGSGLKSIIKASKDTAFIYTGAEFSFVIYPYLKNKNKIFKYSMVSIIFMSFLNTLVTFLSIFYLGTTTSTKYLWPALTLTESVSIPIITNFRFVFLSLFITVVFRCLSAYYFSSSYILNSIFSKISVQNFTLIIYPIIFLIASLYKNTTARRYYAGKITPYYVIFNLIFISLIAFIAFIKKIKAKEQAR